MLYCTVSFNLLYKQSDDMATKTTKQQPTGHQLPLPVPTPRAALYLRVSTEEQAVEGYGLDVQTERTNAQAIAKGMQTIDTYCDPGISGTKGPDERPELARMLADAAARKFDAVIVLSLDRLGRKTSLVLSLVEQLSDVGVALVSCKESLDTSTPQGQFVLTMFAALAQLEAGVIRERTTAGRNERGAVDGEKGGRLPLGYVRVGEDVIDIDPNTARIVRRIFELNAMGLSLRKIANDLNVSGVPTARAHQQRYHGAQWHASNVREVLLNEDAYRGGKRGDSPVCWQPILTDAIIANGQLDLA